MKFAELPVSDQDRAVSFYTEKLKLTVARDSPYGDGRRWIELEIPGAQTHILLSRRSADHDTSTPSLVLIAEDVDAVYQRLLGRGVEFTPGARRGPMGTGSALRSVPGQ